MIRNLFLVIFAAIVTIAGLAGAGLAASPFLLPPPPNIYRTASFEIIVPKGWTCVLDGTEHVCSPGGPPPHRTIVIAAMKYRNGDDTMQAYFDHLSQVQHNATKGGKRFASTIEHVGYSKLGGRTWVDATHYQSELPSFRTRYLATVTAQIGILITFSSHKDSYNLYAPQIEKMVKDLHVYQRFNAATGAPPPARAGGAANR